MNPFDAQMKETAQKIVKDVIGTFSTEYLKHYAIAFVGSLQDQALEVQSKALLLERPEDKSDLKSGYLMKQGALLKGWKKRWFVVRWDYNVDYYATEEDTKKPKAKPKGSRSLAGYRVIPDLNEELKQRANEIAHKFGLDISVLPKPKVYPDTVFELYHYRRRCYTIQCATVEEKAEWVRMFESVTWRAHGLRGWEDDVHVTAFEKAIESTRRKLGRWGWYWNQGYEEQIIADLISDELDYQVVSQLYGKLSGPYAVRNALRNSILKTLDTMTTAAVAPAWKAMDTGVKAIRDKIEPKAKELVGPIAQKKQELLDKLGDAVLQGVKPLLDDKIAPHLSKIVEIIQSPVSTAFDESYKKFDADVEEFKKNANLSDTAAGYSQLDDGVYYMWRITDGIWAMYAPLWALNNIFEDIQPTTTIWNAKDAVKKMFDDAIYTFQQKLNAALEANVNAKSDAAEGARAIDQAKADTLAEYKQDGDAKTNEIYVEIFKCMIMPLINKLVQPVHDNVLGPIQDTIPEPIKEFFDLDGIFDKIVEDIVSKLLESVLKAIKEGGGNKNSS